MTWTGNRPTPCAPLSGRPSTSRPSPPEPTHLTPGDDRIRRVVASVVGRPGGGTGRRSGLKPRGPPGGVQVRFLSRAPAVAPAIRPGEDGPMASQPDDPYEHPYPAPDL